jgi:hypothetical protein
VAEMVCPVERAYLTGLEELRQICNSISNGGIEYRLAGHDEREVEIYFNDSPADDLNALLFAFPILPHVWPYGLAGVFRGRVDGCRMVCLHVWVGRPTKGGIYADGSRLSKDGIADWERFWPRLEASLAGSSESPQPPGIKSQS